jgi:hypothetical protein
MTHFTKEKDGQQSLSITIRVTLVSLLRCIVHYNKHLSGFIDPVKEAKEF